MLKIAYGELKLLPDEFERFSWREFFLMYEGHLRAWEKRYVEPIRVSAYVTYTQGFRGSRKHPKSIKQFWPLNFEKPGLDTDLMVEVMKKAKAKLISEKDGKRT